MEWLRAIRIKQDIKQEGVARLASLSQPAYANIENGRRRPSIDAAKRIAAALDFDWRRFFE